MVKKQVVELLSALCVYSNDGYRLTLDALESFKASNNWKNISERNVCHVLSTETTNCINTEAAFHWADRSGWSCWSAQWNATFRRIGSDRPARLKRRSRSIQYGGRLSNVLTTCFYMNYGRCIELCCQSDAICCESDIILQKSTSLDRLPSLFSKYWYFGLSAVRMCSLYFMVETEWFFILFGSPPQ